MTLKLIFSKPSIDRVQEELGAPGGEVIWLVIQEMGIKARTDFEVS